jgi:BTB/POZ domain
LNPSWNQGFLGRSETCKRSAEYLLPDRLYQTRKYADVVIKCGTYERVVNKAIVTPQSGLVARLVRKADLVAISQPALEDNGASHEYKIAQGSTEIPYVDRKLVKQVIRFLYTGTYNTSEWNKNKKDAQAIPVATGLYAIAQNFEIPALEDKIIRNLPKLVS